MRRLHLGILIVSALAIVSCRTPKSAVNNGEKLPQTTTITDTTSKVDINMPAKDFRAVWIATIGGLDWPRGHFDEASQKAFYEQYLDTLQKLNINAVFFQVRPKADAFYQSEFEPWSMALTWRRDKDPGYEVLKWLIDETHRRGIAFHAWMNPYRVGTRNGRRDRFAPLDSRIPKELVKDYSSVRIYNPAMPETRKRICDIVRDLLEKYDVDGIHFDDYFYPALNKGEKMNDAKEYKKYGKEFSKIEDFRRAMVDSLVVSVRRTINSVRPNVVFSIAPQGNYDNNYRVMYADLAQWSKKGWVDMIIPQLYWSTKKYFPERLKWFADSCTQHSKLAIGYALYRFDGKSKDPYFQDTKDLKKQFELAYNNNKVSGSALYSAHWLLDNPMDIDTVIAQQFPHSTLLPYLGQEPEERPMAPKECTESMTNGDSITLSWLPVDGCYYAIYRTKKGSKDAELVSITYDTTCVVANNYNYYITAVRKGDNAESEPTHAIKK